MSSEWSLTITRGFFSQLSGQEKRGIHLKILYFFGSVEQNELNNLSCYLKIPLFLGQMVLSVASKHEHETKNHVLMQQDRHNVLPPNINFEVWQPLKQSTKSKTTLYETRW